MPYGGYYTDASFQILKLCVCNVSACQLFVINYFPIRYSFFPALIIYSNIFVPQIIIRCNINMITQSQKVQLHVGVTPTVRVWVSINVPTSALIICSKKLAGHYITTCYRKTKSGFSKMYEMLSNIFSMLPVECILTTLSLMVMGLPSWDCILFCGFFFIPEFT